MPFEKKLLEYVHFIDGKLQAEAAIIRQRNDWKPRFLEEQVFPRWAPVVKIKRELKTVLRDLRKSSSTSDIDAAHLRERATHSFFASLHAPSGTNKCRAELAQNDNPGFIQNVLNEPDLLKFLDSIALSVNDADLESWEILAAMTSRLPTEMSLWLIDAPRTLQWLDYIEAGFEIRNVVRMYNLHQVRPQLRSSTLELFQSHHDLGLKFWNRYREEQAYRLNKRRKFFNEEILRAFLKRENPDKELSRDILEDIEREPDVSALSSLSADPRIFALMVPNSMRIPLIANPS